MNCNVWRSENSFQRSVPVFTLLKQDSRFSHTADRRCFQFSPLPPSFRSRPGMKDAHYCICPFSNVGLEDQIWVAGLSWPVLYPLSPIPIPHYFKKCFISISFFVCVHVSVQVLTETPEGYHILWSYNFPDVEAGNQTLVLCKAARALNC